MVGVAQPASRLVRGRAEPIASRGMALRRDRRFRRLVADAKATMERGDAEGTRELLRRCPVGYERVVAGELFGYSSPLGKNEPPDLLLELYDRVRRVPLSVINAY